MVGRTKLFQEIRSPLIRGFTRPARARWKTAAMWIAVLVLLAVAVFGVTSWIYHWPVAL